MFDGFDPRDEPYDPMDALHEARDEERYWEDQPVPVLTPEQLHAVEFVESGNIAQNETALKGLMAGLTKEQQEQVRIEKLRRAHLPPVLNPEQLQALERLEQVREKHREQVRANQIDNAPIRFQVENAALAGLTDREQWDVREVAERRIWRWLAENGPGGKAPTKQTPEEQQAHDAEWARMTRALVAEARRAGTPDPRYNGRERALQRTETDQRFMVFAEASRKMIHKRGSALPPGGFIYTVWAGKYRQAVWLAEMHVFASGPLEPGILSIAKGDTGEIIGQAEYLADRNKGV